MRDSDNWQSAPASQTVWAGWDGIHLVFHRPSGKTHVVNEAGASLIRDILLTPQSSATAALALAEIRSATADDEYKRNVALILERFERLGLVLRA